MVIVLMGVTGSGKTTIGRLLSQELGWRYYDADDFHPLANNLGRIVPSKFKSKTKRSASSGISKKARSGRVVA